MKKNGFTLVELLAVIIILCITVTIVIVNVDKNINDANDFGNDLQIKSIESAAQLYVEENKENLTNLNEKNVDLVTLETLIDFGLLTEKNLKNFNKSDLVLLAILKNNIKVKYIGTIQNVIFLNGPSNISIYVGDEYSEMGAYVAIPETGIIEIGSSNISSTVNTTTIGEYKVTYSYENTTSQERIVSVIN